MKTKFAHKFLALLSVGAVIPLGGCLDDVPESDVDVVNVDVVEDVGEAEVAVCSAWASDVYPMSAEFQKAKLFYVFGTCLPSTLALWIADCANMQKVNSTSTKVTFRCTPSYSKGWKDGVVKDKPGGTILYQLDVSVY